jgi:hypothetical protein
MIRSMKVRAALAALAALGCLVAVAATPTASADSQAGSATSTADLQKLAQQQTNLLLKFYQGQSVSPSKCGEGQGAAGVGGVFLLPVAFGPGDQTLNCTTNARSVLVDLGGFLVIEDPRFPDSFYELPNGDQIPFTRENLEPICNDVIANVLGDTAPATATLDGRDFTGQVINSGVFTAQVNRKAQAPDGTDYWADSVGLGHPGRLATVFCGFKAEVPLSPGTHTIVVDYTGAFGASTILTFNITVKG